jgi:Fe-S cluster assembly protein SufD
MDASSMTETDVRAELASSHNDAHTWDDLVAQAKERYENTPLPDRTNEDWHYGDPRKFDAAGLTLAPVEAAASRLLDGDRLSPPQVGELIATDHFAAQHIATSTDPHYIHIEKNKDAGEIHIELAAQSGGYATAQTLFLQADAFATADIFLHCSGGAAEQRNLHSVMVFANVADGARISVTRVQNYGSRTDALLREYASVGRDATYTSNVVQLGGLNVRAEAHVELAQPGASAFLRGAYLASGRQRFDFLTHQNHQAPNATSNLLYKGALLGRARAS